MSPLPRIKVCGLKSPADVAAATRAGADAVGFVHYPPSPRHLLAADAAPLVASLPAGVAAVVVLVDAQPAHARAFLDASGAGWVQLCGDEDPAAWRDFGAPILRRVAVADGAGDELARWDGIAAGFVLDHADGPGGTGRGVDVERAAALAASAPCLLAGGLDGANVTQRIRAVRPAGVDASSRLESTPGRKDPTLVQAFVAAARAALSERTAP